MTTPPRNRVSDRDRQAVRYGRAFSPRDLSRMLRPYGVAPKVVKLGQSTARGYHRDDLEDAWSRYLPAGSVTDVTSVTPLASTVTEVTPVTDTPAEREAAS